MLRKVQHQDALQISDVVMASLLRMFQSTAGSGGVQEDALMAVSTLVEGRCCAGGAGGSGAGQSPCASFSFLLSGKKTALVPALLERYRFDHTAHHICH